MSNRLCMHGCVAAVTGIAPLQDARHAGVLERESLELLVAPLTSAMHVHAVVAISDAQRPRLRHAGRFWRLV
jgi:hypothetical protein